MRQIDRQQPAIPDGLERRTLLLRVGVAGASAAGVLILSACGGAQEAASKATGAAGTATEAIKNAIKTAEIPVGGGTVFPQLGRGRHSAGEGRVQGLFVHLHARGQPDRQRLERHDQLPIARQHVRHLDRAR